MTRPRGICAHCGKRGPIYALGLCGPCYEDKTHAAVSRRPVRYEALRGRRRRQKVSKHNPWPYRGDT